jgi:hypothetical protein
VIAFGAAIGAFAGNSLARWSGADRDGQTHAAINGIGLILDWSPTVAGWWSLFVIGLSTIVWTRLAEREERTRKSHGHGCHDGAPTDKGR